MVFICVILKFGRLGEHDEVHNNNSCTRVLLIECSQQSTIATWFVLLQHPRSCFPTWARSGGGIFEKNKQTFNRFFALSNGRTSKHLKQHVSASTGSSSLSHVLSWCMEPHRRFTSVRPRWRTRPARQVCSVCMFPVPAHCCRDVSLISFLILQQLFITKVLYQELKLIASLKRTRTIEG